MQYPESVARRLFELVEPICLVTFFADEAAEDTMALGFDTYWDAYFAGRSGPLGRVPAEVVDALFYNFAPGEVARHLPSVWEVTTPEAAAGAWEGGSARSVRRILGDLADAPGTARATELLLAAGTSAATEGRAVFAAFRTRPVPEEPAARLWHAANLLREHRGDGHVAALLGEGVGRTECHVLLALDIDMPPREFGRIHHLPTAYLDTVIGGLQERGLVDADERFTEAGRAVKARVEARTDALAAPAYAALEPAEVEELVELLGPIAARLASAG